MTPSKQEQRRKGRPKKEDISLGPDHFVDATRELLKTHHPNKLTQKLVAQAANADPKLLRYYFGSLDQLLVEVAHRYINDLNSRMATASIIEGSTNDIIRRRMTTLLRFYVEEPNFWNLVMEKIYLSTDQRAANVRKDFNRNSLTRLTNIIELGIGNNEVVGGVDSRLLYIAMIGLSEIFSSAQPIVDVLFSRYEQETLMNDYGDFIVRLVMMGLTPRNVE